MKKIVVTLFAVFGLISLLNAQTIVPQDAKKGGTEFIPFSSDYNQDSSVTKITVTSDTSIILNKNDGPFKQPEVIKVMIIKKRD